MFELLTVALFIWLLVKVIGMALKMTWGMAKIAASILIGLALPALIIIILFFGGIAILVPVAMIAAAAGILKACL